MTVTYEHDGDIAVVTVDNPPVNALGQAVRQGLWDAAEALDADPRVRAVVLLCAGRTFIAGADVREFGKPPAPPHLPDLIDRIEAAAKPWVAAIHGAALGGGFEVALGCRFRLAEPSARVGLPEVTLGIVPGAGGTVRTPRLAGVETAVEMITSGKPMPAKQAQAKGLIDDIVQGELRTDAVAFARAALSRPLPPVLRDRPVAAVPDGFWQQAEAEVTTRARGIEAPLRALACIRRAAEADFETALAHERETFLALRATPQAAALRHVFFAERAAPRPAELKGVQARPLAHVGVVGGGTMGAGIAAALRNAGLPVTMIERDAAAAERGRGNVQRIFDSSVKRGRLSAADAAQRLSGLSVSTDYAALAPADLVIEAVFEDLNVKRAVFAELAHTCRADAILATNTSYLDPRAIAADLPGAERFLGLHFFSPAHVMKLLEIIEAPDTAPQTLATGFALAQKLGKIPVRAGICDGFIGNRILKVTRAQAERLLLAGCSPAQVDAAMRGFGQPMGPFEAQDLGGLDIAAFQRAAARERGLPVFAPVAERLCEMGRLGQKTGGGWYDYAPEERRPQPSDVVAGVIAEVSQGRDMTIPDGLALSDAILLPMVNEGAQILAEGVARRASDIDLVMIHGYGFPRGLGGLMHWAEARGLAAISGTLARLAQIGLAEPPCPSLLQAAEAGGFSE